MIPDKKSPTKAFVVEGPGAPYVLKDVVLDEVRPQEVLVEMKYTGLCHTVWNPKLNNTPQISNLCEGLEKEVDLQDLFRIWLFNKVRSHSVNFPLYSAMKEQELSAELAAT